MDKKLIFSGEEVREVAKEFGTPLHLYSEAKILDFLNSLDAAFSWSPNFKNYFAVKALPNPSILHLIAKQGSCMDCSSYPELLLCESVGVIGDRVLLTSNNTSLRTYKKAKEIGAFINVDDVSHIPFLIENDILPELICFRYNPGKSRTGNLIIGEPEEAKFGMTEEQLMEAYRLCLQNGVKHFGLHTMVVSNCLEMTELLGTASMIFSLAAKIQKETGAQIEFVNLGGGIGVAYKPEEKSINLNLLSEGIQKLYNSIIAPTPLHPLRIVYENGRAVTGPAGVLITRVIHQKNTYKKYLGVDGGIWCLMRPALYDSYHHMTVIDDDANASLLPYLPRTRNIFTDADSDTVYDVVGSLCENNDKLCKNRKLGIVRIGDLIAIHDTGAHGHAMGFNYNGALRPREVLLELSGRRKLIRRSEEEADLVATVENWPGGSKKVFFSSEKKKKCPIDCLCPAKRESPYFFSLLLVCSLFVVGYLTHHRCH